MSFLETLQKKSAEIQNTRSGSFPDQIVQALIDGNVRQSEIGSTQAPEYFDRPACRYDVAVICDVVTARDRLDIQFPDGKPDQVVIEDLKLNGFRWNRASQCWFHRNDDRNRETLKTLFGIEISQDMLTDEESEKSSENEAQEPETPVSPEFKKYRDQVDTLIEVLGVRPADLMLLAVDSLYREKIGELN